MLSLKVDKGKKLKFGKTMLLYHGVSQTEATIGANKISQVMSDKGRRLKYLAFANHTSTFKGSPHIGAPSNTALECSIVTQPSSIANTLNAYVE